VGLRAGLDTEVRGKSFASAGDRTSIAQSFGPYPDTVLTQLPRLIDVFVCYPLLVNIFSEM
jgi:hypothetical protein